MKLSELLTNLDKTNTSLQSTPDWEELAYEFNVNLSWSDDTRLKAYYVSTWYCTDTYVGIEVYLLDDEFVCLSYKHSRKSSPEFQYASLDATIKLRDYLVSLTEPEDNLPTGYITGDYELGEGYNVNFSDELLPCFHKQGRLADGRLVTLLGYDFKEPIVQKVTVRHTDFKIEEVQVSEITFEYHKYFSGANFENIKSK